ncbi:MAG: SDR family oxidoreductase [Pseudomonadota bacterium]
MKPVALITGGARGIGRAIAEELARDHAIAISYNTTPPDGLLAKWPETLSIQADLSRSDVPSDVVAEVLRRFGRLDVIVNNAGTVLADDADLTAMLSVNLASPIALVEAALPHLGRGAAILNISSMNARLPAMGALGYSASKAALDTWTRGLAKTLGPQGIRVNAIAPGAIERVEAPRPPELLEKFVALTALGRPGVPQDIAKAARFLLSDDASFITGETLVVSGGYRL